VIGGTGAIGDGSSIVLETRSYFHLNAFTAGGDEQDGGVT
jgi:hypothetical protein